VKRHLPILGLVFGLALVLSGATSSKFAPTRLFGDRKLEIDPEDYRHLETFLASGSYADGDIKIDASAVQTVEVKDGAVVFNPPIKVRWKFVSSSVDTMSIYKAGQSILVDINHSPIDLQIVPE
jgi:hypothetical protein